MQIEGDVGKRSQCYEQCSESSVMNRSIGCLLLESQIPLAGFLDHQSDKTSI